VLASDRCLNALDIDHQLFNAEDLSTSFLMVVPGFKSLILSCGAKAERDKWFNAIIAAADQFVMEDAFRSVAQMSAGAEGAAAAAATTSPPQLGGKKPRPSMRLSGRKSLASPNPDAAAEKVKTSDDYTAIKNIVDIIAENTQVSLWSNLKCVGQPFRSYAVAVDEVPTQTP